VVISARSTGGGATFMSPVSTPQKAPPPAGRCSGRSRQTVATRRFVRDSLSIPTESTLIVGLSELAWRRESGLWFQSAQVQDQAPVSASIDILSVSVVPTASARACKRESPR
jgi:hypothetical protein